MEFRKWLNETPIANLELKGDWENPKSKSKMGYDPASIAILKSQKARDIIVKKWSNTKENFNLIFLKKVVASKHSGTGEVSPEWVKTNLGIDYEPVQDAINVIYINNKGDQKTPLTAWIIAHRLGHAISRFNKNDSFEEFTNEIRRNFVEILKHVYNFNVRPTGIWYIDQENLQKRLLSLATAVCSFKSARNKNIRNFNEVFYELLAEYIITGKIEFLTLPQTIGSSSFGRQKLYSNGEDYKKEYDQQLESLSRDLTYYLDNVLESCVNKTYVM